MKLLVEHVFYAVYLPDEVVACSRFMFSLWSRIASCVRATIEE